MGARYCGKATRLTALIAALWSFPLFPWCGSGLIIGSPAHAQDGSGDWVAEKGGSCLVRKPVADAAYFSLFLGKIQDSGKEGTCIRGKFSGKTNLTFYNFQGKKVGDMTGTFSDGIFVGGRDWMVSFGRLDNIGPEGDWLGTTKDVPYISYSMSPSTCKGLITGMPDGQACTSLEYCVKHNENGNLCLHIHEETRVENFREKLNGNGLLFIADTIYNGKGDKISLVQKTYIGKFTNNQFVDGSYLETKCVYPSGDCKYVKNIYRNGRIESPPPPPQTQAQKSCTTVMYRVWYECNRFDSNGGNFDIELGTMAGCREDWHAVSLKAIAVFATPLNNASDTCRSLKGNSSSTLLTEPTTR